jgi:hypothetical protein
LVVQELGWDEDVDDDVRIMVEDAIDGELIEDAMEAVDLVLLWWRDGRRSGRWFVRRSDRSH